MRALRPHLLALTLLAWGGVPAHAAATLVYQGGGAVSDRMAEAELRPALRQVGDSLALARAVESLLDRYQQAAYLDARVERAEWRGESLYVQVVPGARVHWRQIRIDAPSPAESVLVASVLDVRAGDPASPEALGATLDRALSGLEGHGRPYAQLTVRTMEGHDGAGQVVIGAVLGPEVIVTAVRFDGLEVTRPDLAQKVVGRMVGKPYDPAAAEAGRQRLEDLGLFRRVQVAPLEGETDWTRAHVVYQVEEPTYNAFEGALGFQGQNNLAGLAHLGLGNLLGTGRAIDLRWENRGSGISEFTARYGEPMLLGSRLGLELNLLQNVQDTLYTRTQWGGRLRIPLHGHEGADAGYTHERVVADNGEVEEANLQTTRFGLDSDRRDDRDAPRRGMRVRLEGAQTHKTERLRPAGERSFDESSFEWRGEWHRPISRPAGLAFEWIAAGRFSSQPVLPDYERYPVGGARSLRGYNEEAFRVDRYVLLRSEARLFAGANGQRVFAFFDQAWMQTKTAPTPGVFDTQRLWKTGVGVGMRLDSRAGRIGVDYGLEPGRAPLEGKLHLLLESRF